MGKARILRSTKQRKTWNKEQMKKAIELVRSSDVGYMKAAKMFDVPRSTLARLKRLRKTNESWSILMMTTEAPMKILYQRHLHLNRKLSPESLIARLNAPLNIGKNISMDSDDSDGTDSCTLNSEDFHMPGDAEFFKTVICTSCYKGADPKTETKRIGHVANYATAGFTHAV